jgi:hypothetical protein
VRAGCGNRCLTTAVLTVNARHRIEGDSRSRDRSSALEEYILPEIALTKGI